MRSLRARLGVGLVASLIAVFLLQWLVVTFAVQEVAQRYVLTRLGHDMDALLAGLQPPPTPNAPVTLDPARIGPIYQQPFSGHYFHIAAGDTVIRSRSLWDQDLPVTAPAPGGRRIDEIAGPQEQQLLVLARSFTLRDIAIVIAVAEDLTPLAQDLARFNLRYGLISTAALVALLLVLGLIVRIGLRPLDRTRGQIAELETGRIAQLNEDVPHEIQPLVRELNRLLSAMNERLRRSREALGNLAHALKGPLTLATNLADEAPLRGSPQRAQLLAHTDAIRQLIDRELKRARLAGASASLRRFDFANDLPPLLDTLRAIYRDKPLDIKAQVAPHLSYPVEREDMLELLGNLLDNACKWARTRVRLTIANGEGLRLTVKDDGPGAEPDELASITERGVRLDEAKPGHGLGLAIARDIVATYGGELKFSRSDALGGLMVNVMLPLRARK